MPGLLLPDFGASTYTIVAGGKPRTNAERWVERPNIQDWYAEPDTSTDQTDRVQTAIDAMSATGGGELDVGKGNFRIDGTLQLKSRVTLRGNLNGLHISYAQQAAPWVSRLSKFGNGDLIQIGDNVVNAGVHGLQLNGPNTGATTGSGVVLGSTAGGADSDYNFVEGCNFLGFSDHAIRVNSGTAHRIANNIATRCLLNRTRSQVDGVLHFEGGTDHVIEGGEYNASNAGRTAGGQCWALACYGVQTAEFRGGVYELSDGGVYVASTATRNRFITGRSDHNYGHGVWNNGSNEWTTWYCLNNSLGTTTYYSFFSNTGGSGHLSVYNECVSDFSIAGIAAGHFADDAGNAVNVPEYRNPYWRGGPGIQLAFSNNAGGCRTVQARGSTPFALTANATAPQVYSFPECRTQNSSATRYTDFSSNNKWQTMILYVEDANTTIGNTVGTNVGIRTGTGADVVVANGRTLTFRRIGGVWCMQ